MLLGLPKGSVDFSSSPPLSLHLHLALTGPKMANSGVNTKCMGHRWVSFRTGVFLSGCLMWRAEIREKSGSTALRESPASFSVTLSAYDMVLVEDDEVVVASAPEQL